VDIARVVVEKTTPHFDKEYDYLVPEALRHSLRPGCRVLVPFGQGDRLRVGLVVALAEGNRSAALKSIAVQADPEPVINAEGLMLLNYLKRQTYCRYFEGLSVLIPPGVGISLSRVARLVRPLPEPLPPMDAEMQEVLSLLTRRRGEAVVAALLEQSTAADAAGALGRLERAGLCELIEDTRRRSKGRTDTWVALTGEQPERPPTPKQQALLDLLESQGEMFLSELMALGGAGRSVVTRLEQQGLIALSRRPYQPPELPLPHAKRLPLPVLSPAQAHAADELSALLGQGAQTALLHGVTGSGKTSVYLHLIRKVIEQGRQAMVLVPEISLTPQAAALFSGCFGADTAVIHSGLSMGERVEAYRRIRAGEVKILVGTRSAVFSPLENIGLIIVDEEQEHTYHSESAPRYHAKEVAALRCRHHGALLLLGSATPSVESYQAAKTGRMALITLTERYNEAPLPEVRTVDLKEAPLAGESSCITQELAEELSYNLDRGEQSILLLNRRGYHTLVKCSNCGQAAKCPHCEVALTYHAVGRRLICHYCGYQRSAEGACDSCGSGLVRYTGVGTQRVEEELSALFPEVRILRVDADTTGSRYAHQRAFADFADGKYAIMVGTQMVAKGLNFPRVTLVGVLLADQSFYSDDFRSYERSFALITQVVGRCGRGELPGRAIIQTYTPENRIIPLAAAQDYPAFFRDEILFRKVGLYPPFCDFVRIAFMGEDQQAVERAAQAFADRLAATAAKDYPDLPLRLLGPAPFAVPKVAGRWRSRLLLKCRRGEQLRRLLTGLYTDFYASRQHGGVLCVIDPFADGN
jgi:primosomal protein N' (replication factor Y)